MNVTVIGTGYVGLVTGTVFSVQGHRVTCVDIDQSKVEGLKRGVLPIYEPGLEEYVLSGIENGTLDFTTDVVGAAASAEVLFLAVGTPQSEDGSADLQYLMSAAEGCAGSIRDDAVVVIKSTVPVGTNVKVSALMERIAGRPVDVANNPEFLKEGTALDDCLRPDRIVLGVRNERAAQVLADLYEPLVQSCGGCPVLTMEPESAEMTKYVANCMLATKISFINEMAMLCEGLGANIDQVREGIGTDRRIGFQFLKPGAGYGGSCFPKDVKALWSQGREIDMPTQMLSAVHQVNERQKSVMPSKVLEHFDGTLEGKRIAVWGLAFKPGTDDIREAPALTLIDALLGAGAEVSVHDPEAMENVRGVYGHRIQYETNKWDSTQNADALVVMTEWDEYVGIDVGTLRWHLKEPVLFDGRNCMNEEDLALASFEHLRIGHGETTPEGNSSWEPNAIAMSDCRSEATVLGN